jgi:sarcosine oxidase/L-pipecolate oxidase
LNVASTIELLTTSQVSSQLYDLQYGFQSGKSTTAQMLYVFHEIHNVLEKRGQVDTVYLDFAKAFDKVSHDLLLVKLHNFGIRGNLLRWFGDSLSGRLQRVTVLGVTSEPLPVLSGVPQGSILGPLLFLIYVNDLPKTTSHDTTVTMFADDTKCHRHLRNLQDTIILQQDLDSVANWCNDWRMDLNQTTCVVMHFSRIAQPMITQYTLSYTPVLQSSSQKDLGITTTNDLKWNKQVQEISTKANKMLGFVKRTAFDHSPA